MVGGDPVKVLVLFGISCVGLVLVLVLFDVIKINGINSSDESDDDGGGDGGVTMGNYEDKWLIEEV